MNRGAWRAAVCGVTRVRYGLAIKQQHLWVARTQTPKVSVSVITADLSGWCICEQSRGIPELLFCWQFSGCACVFHRPMCCLGFRVAPVLETGGLCAIAPFAGEQPRGGSHPVAHVSPSTVVTKWEEALVSLLLLWWGSDGWLWFIICTLLLLPSMLLFLRVLEFFQQITSYWEPLEGSRIDGRGPIQSMERPQWGRSIAVQVLLLVSGGPRSWVSVFYFLCVHLLAALRGLRNLSSPARDWTCALCVGRVES